MTESKSKVNRRRLLTTLGAAGVFISGLSSSAVANEMSDGNRGGKISLNDGSVDILVYWSSGDAPNDFGYPFDLEADPQERGLFLAGHDPEKGGMFDYSKFELTPDGNTLHNSFELFHGALLASEPKSYPLSHQSNGIFKSRGQVMNFDVLPEDSIPLVNPETGTLLPPIDILAGDSWRVVGTDVAKLVTDEDGNPTPNGEWGVTRVDVYKRGGGHPEYVLSLMYLIWGATDPTRLQPTPQELIADIPPAVHPVVHDLMRVGPLNQGGQPRGR